MSFKIGNPHNNVSVILYSGSIAALALAKKDVVSKHAKRDKLEKQLEGGVAKFLCRPFAKSVLAGERGRDVRVGLAMAWVHYLRAMQNSYQVDEASIEGFVVEAIKMLNGISDSRSASETEDSLVHSRACVLYVIKVGVLEGMGEEGQRRFLKRLLSLLSKVSPNGDFHSTLVMLRSMSWLLKLVGKLHVSHALA